MHIDEYPPDANQGFDIPSAVISYPDFQASIQFVEDKSLETLPILAKLQVIRTLMLVIIMFYFWIRFIHILISFDGFVM